MGTVLAEPLYMGVDTKRFLREVPAFFQSFEDALAELVQNAYRANASRIDITLDMDARTLEVKDDGRGCGDPRALVTAGMTGWDEDVVVDPAGLGLFALLGLSSEVVIETRGYRNDGYRMRLTQECFSGKPVELEELPWEEGPELHGLHLRAKIGEKADIKVEMDHRCHYRTFRHLFPIHVTFTRIQNGHTQTYDMPPTVLDTPYIDTPVGRIQWGPRDDGRYYHHGLIAVWEHRTLTMPNNGRLWDEVERLLGGRFVKELLLHKELIWFVDERSSVRPKLPDRRELIQDENYAAALREIARALLAAFDVPGIAAQIHGMELDAELPRGSDAYCRAARTIHEKLEVDPFFRRAGLTCDMALQIAGYQKQEWEILGEWELDWYESDACSVNLGEETGFFRYPLRTKSCDLADALCREGLYTLHNPGDPELEVRIEGARITKTPAGMMGVADGIKVYSDGKLVGSLNRFTPMDRVTFQVGEEEERDSAFILVGTPEELLETVRESRWDDEWMSWALRSLDNSGYLCDYMDGDCEDNDLHTDRLRTDTVARLLKLFYPTVGREAERFAALETWADNWNRQYGNLTWERKKVADLHAKYPEVTELGELIKILDQLSAWRLDTWKYEPKVLEQGVNA